MNNRMIDHYIIYRLVISINEKNIDTYKYFRHFFIMIYLFDDSLGNTSGGRYENISQLSMTGMITPQRSATPYILDQR